MYDIMIIMTIIHNSISYVMQKYTLTMLFLIQLVTQTLVLAYISKMTTIFLNHCSSSQYGRLIQLQNILYDCTHNYGFQQIQNKSQCYKLCCLCI
jgi:hypothetical protein